MVRTWLTILILFVVVAVLWTVFEGTPGRTPPSPPGVQTGDEEPTHPLMPALSGPFPSLSGRPEGESPPGAVGPAEPPDPDRERLLELAGAAMQRAGVLLKGTLDIDSYLHGGGSFTGERIEVSPEIVARLFDLLKTAPPDQKLRVAVAFQNGRKERNLEEVIRVSRDIERVTSQGGEEASDGPL